MTEDLRKVAEEALYLYRISPSHVKVRKQCQLLGALAKAWMEEHPVQTDEPKLPDEFLVFLPERTRPRKYTRSCPLSYNEFIWDAYGDWVFFDNIGNATAQESWDEAKERYVPPTVQDFGPQKQPASVTQVEAQTKAVRKSMVERLSE